MDKNFVIGLVLIMLMLIGYQVLVPKPVEPTPVAEVKKAAAKPASVASDTTQNSSQSVDSTVVPQKDLVIETKDARVVFTNKGGVMKEVMLKNYKTYDQKPLYLIAEKHNNFQIDLPTQTGDVRLTNQTFTTDAQDRTLAEGDSAVITYRATLKNNQTVEQTYVVRGSGYVIDYGIKVNGALPANKSVEFHWDNDLLQLENDMKKNREVVTVNYYTDELKSLPTSPTSNEEEKTADPVKWFTIKHKYFLAGLIAEKQPLTNVTMRANVNAEDSVIVKNMNIFAGIPTAAVQKGEANFQFYLGPNEYHIVDKVKAENFDQNVYLGYAFLKPINKFFLVPLFNLLEGFVSNYGLLIILLVLFVKTLLTPLTYKSYISMAKMRILAPELEQIREANKDDIAKQQQEQMKLYQQVGVSPLSGCVPVLATMPILFSLFFLFPNLIELRQQSFLWASDLSTYDSFFKLPFNVPFGIGNHISLFTILMTASSIGYAYYNNQNTPTQPGPVNMKALGYVMPLMFMFILNSFPAGLTFYYFVSNIVTIAQQLLIKRFVNEDKIKNILEENRKKNATGEKKQNKFQKYLEKSLQAAEEAKKKQAELEKKTKKK
ncbi:YidC/Oxa1 family membrane protein insertase [Dyadobacter sp. BE34]|uniref:Membrane protein insertase YidC n=1 Tax=Dyadobacter fermentans TaxID=94254 RepID=A0ABU1QX31_9BACT|nr:MULTISPECIES: membrane protein insertase YidC [Dyadobacter]MDR6805710.1 YidC/Oxa1 family membrane protein insertase [Dyadobacter fermentans]MDR7042530.1 YidC/Oxa1 family membrane protein insertase [Dyadobacter sp. BE242]MDR7196842.1 YidC/Oxa1 family membrane protein insertase [Dyadobacter sp. BE34]MDR7215723.1 YidC/Oxa1 family membrane protein insertase [Dyadobacter sp. BE31]MDR7263259.1 YidC/Oxa1 family membrane protein insertase [Dyadobacter sp. BE32]